MSKNSGANTSNNSQPNKDQILRLCRELLPGGRKVGHEYHSYSLRGGSGDKCRINTKTGRWSYIPKGHRDRGFISTDQKNWRFGNNIVQLISASICISESDAEDYLNRFLNRR